jgi:hypothetical protein
MYQSGGTVQQWEKKVQVILSRALWLNEVAATSQRQNWTFHKSTQLWQECIASSRAAVGLVISDMSCMKIFVALGSAHVSPNQIFVAFFS